MSIIKNIKLGRLFTAILLIAAGLALGALLFSGNGSSENNNTTAHEHVEGQEWTCSMHPQVRQDGPGKCPICGMDLIPVAVEKTYEAGMDAIELSEEAMKLAQVQTMTVERGAPAREITLAGVVTMDERENAEVTARFAGRIEKLYINYTGQKVRKGQALATIYSPELITAQRELLEAAKLKESSPQYYQAARSKLKLWDLSESQINAIESSGEAKYNMQITSPVSGTVMMKNVNEGDYVKEGTKLFEVADLDHLWVLFDAYEDDLRWINTGDMIHYRITSYPGRDFMGKVQFIDPQVDAKSRVSQVRVEVSNAPADLKPGMLATGIVKAKVTGLANNIVVPKSAVLWTGKRGVVYVQDTAAERPVFQYREVVLGETLAEHYVIASGLRAGETIAVNGAFQIDAAAQLQGKQSMMNPEGGKTSTGHQHGSESTDDSKEQEHNH